MATISHGSEIIGASFGMSHFFGLLSCGKVRREFGPAIVANSRVIGLMAPDKFNFLSIDFEI